MNSTSVSCVTSGHCSEQDRLGLGLQTPSSRAHILGQGRTWRSPRAPAVQDQVDLQGRGAALPQGHLNRPFLAKVSPAAGNAQPGLGSRCPAQDCCGVIKTRSGLCTELQNHSEFRECRGVFFMLMRQLLERRDGAPGRGWSPEKEPPGDSRAGTLSCLAFRDRAGWRLSSITRPVMETSTPTE